MFFWSPFFFLLPILFVMIVFRLGIGLFRGFFDHRDPYRERRRVGHDDSAGLWPDEYGYRRPLPNVLRRSNMESRIFRLAYRLNGKVTVSDVVLETSMSVGEAEAYMDRLTDGVRVRMEIGDAGLVQYEFPEIIERLNNND